MAERTDISSFFKSDTIRELVTYGNVSFASGLFFLTNIILAVDGKRQCLKFRPLVCIFIGHIRPLAEVIKPSRPLVASRLPKVYRIFGHYLCT